MVEVWPECERAVGLFLRLRTQWRIGMSGPTGMDYGAMYPLMERMALDADAWDELLDDIRALESAALDEIHTKDD